MRHPILRILIAILIGFWSPMCCCQASELLGAPCAPSQQSHEESCCSGCGDTPEEPTEPHDSGQPCTECHWSFAQAGVVLNSEHGGTLSTDAVTTIATFGTICTLLIADAGQPRHPDHHPPRPAGRSLLRWHCALIV